jgi:aromatic-L-amino-acid/L-tryptophan decarboxylase
MMELGGARLVELIDTAGRTLRDFVDQLTAAPAMITEDTTDVVSRVTAAPAEEPGDALGLVALVREAANLAVETTGPRFLAYVPSGGDPVSAVGELLARGFNRYGSLAIAAPALAALEDGVLRWFAELFGLPAGSGGLLTTGGSQATLSMIVAARERHLGEDLGSARIYLSDQANHCVAKAAKIAGFPARALRVLPTSDSRHLDPAVVAAAIAQDRAAGLRPFLLVASAGTTGTGDIDPLPELAAIAAAEDLWFHVDACYGGFFQLTERGRERLHGVELADSVSLDPHKGLFLPFGTGALLVRDLATLAAAHTPEADVDYFTDYDAGAVPDFADLGTELSRENRGLRVWLPLHTHGLAAYRQALDEQLDNARHAHESLSADPHLVVPHQPELSTIVFHLGNSDDEANLALLKRVNASRRVYLSSTRLRGRVVLRMCLLSHRCHREHIDEALAVITAAAAPVTRVAGSSCTG